MRSLHNLRYIDGEFADACTTKLEDHPSSRKFFFFPVGYS